MFTTLIPFFFLDINIDKYVSTQKPYHSKGTFSSEYYRKILLTHPNPIMIDRTTYDLKIYYFNDTIVKKKLLTEGPYSFPL